MIKNISLFVCYECGSNKNIHNHHIIPKSRGGKKTIPLCEVCHGLVHDINFVNLDFLRNLGIEKAKLSGTYKGRIKGTSENLEDFISKYPKLIEALNNNMSLRKAANYANVSLGTAQKFKKIFQYLIV